MKLNLTPAFFHYLWQEWAAPRCCSNVSAALPVRLPLLCSVTVDAQPSDPGFHSHFVCAVAMDALQSDAEFQELLYELGLMYLFLLLLFPFLFYHNHKKCFIMNSAWHTHFHKLFQQPLPLPGCCAVTEESLYSTSRFQELVARPDVPIFAIDDVGYCYSRRG